VGGRLLDACGLMFGEEAQKIHHSKIEGEDTGVGGGQENRKVTKRLKRKVIGTRMRLQGHRGKEKRCKNRGKGKGQGGKVSDGG